MMLTGVDWLGCWDATASLAPECYLSYFVYLAQSRYKNCPKIIYNISRLYLPVRVWMFLGTLFTSFIQNLDKQLNIIRSVN